MRSRGMIKALEDEAIVRYIIILKFSYCSTQMINKFQEDVGDLGPIFGN